MNTDLNTIVVSSKSSINTRDFSHVNLIKKHGFEESSETGCLHLLLSHKDFNLVRKSVYIHSDAGVFRLVTEVSYKNGKKDVSEIPLYIKDSDSLSLFINIAKAIIV